MKFCLYQPKDKYLNKADEVSITLPSIKRMDLQKLIDTLLKFKDKKINLSIVDSKDFVENDGMPLIEAIKVKYPELNLSLMLVRYDHDEFNDALLNYVKLSNLPFFYTTYISDWETLHFYKNLNVSEMYICGELGFERDKVSEVLHDAGIKIRVIPNAAQCKEVLGNNLTAFYIRPEDMEKYAEYVDVFEFYCTTSQEEETLYKIYAITKEWPGKLSSLILWLEGELEGKFITPIFGSRRTKCAHKCLKGNSCSICETTEQLCITMHKAHAEQLPLR